jgi:hypothetical protein
MQEGFYWLRVLLSHEIWDCRFLPRNFQFFFSSDEKLRQHFYQASLPADEKHASYRHPAKTTYPRRTIRQDDKETAQDILLRQDLFEQTD